MYNHNSIIGLTGPTGSGKSTVAKVWQACGAVVLNADEYARAVVQKGEPCLTRLAEEFSVSVLTPNGELNRAALAAIVFADPEKKRLLESITHPEIGKRMLRDAEHALASGAPFVVFDSPLLFEAGQDALCAKTVAVLSEPQVRLARIKVRDNLTDEQAVARMPAQPDDAIYTDRADIVLRNDGDEQALVKAAKEVWSCL